MSNTPVTVDSRLLPVKPIGVIHAPFKQATGTPIQPKSAHDARGTVELFEMYREGLADLEGFDRIWLVCWFHLACAPSLRVVPYLDDTERGLFATRAPSRPNPIGISPCRLLSIDKNILTVGDLDILDGTPLLDIKPYAPRFDCFPGSRSGWLDQAGDRNRVADGRFESTPPSSKRR